MAKKSVWEKNFATDAKVRDRVLGLFDFQKIRDARVQLNDDFERWSNMYNVTKDGSHFYNGRAELYVPEVRKNVNSQTRQLVEAAFPNDDFFDVIPDYAGNATPQGAEMHKVLRLHQIKQAKLRQKYHIFTRQKVLLGTSVARIPWREEMKTTFRSKISKDGKSRKMSPARKKYPKFIGPDFIPVSMFRWYALNPFKSDWTEDGCVEFIPKSRTEILKEKKNLWGVDKILEGPSDAKKTSALEQEVRMMEERGIQVTDAGSMGEASIAEAEANAEMKSYLMGLVFTEMVLDEALEDDEERGIPIPVMIKIFNDEHVALVQRNPYYDQMPPYITDTYILPEPSMGPYGQGIPKAIQYMQYEVNAKAEQGMDSATLALNPIAFIDPALAGNKNDFEIEPAAQWFVSPEGVKFGAIPDLTSTAYQAMAMLRGQISDFSDLAPALPPQLQGKSRSATQADIIDRAVTIDHKSFAMQAEENVLEPLMEKWEMLTDQNVTEDLIISVLGPRSSQWKRWLISREALQGKYNYHWKVASNLQNKAILTRQMIDILKVIGSFPPQILQNVRFNFSEFLKMIYKEGFALPNAHKIFGDEKLFGQEQSPEMEHKILDMGGRINVAEDDNDAEHLQKHDLHLASLRDGERKDALAAHLLAHRQQFEEKKKRAQQLLRQIQIQSAQQQEEDQRGSRSGNRTQLSPNATAGDQGSGVRA